jgi:hypothetical protein
MGSYSVQLPLDDDGFLRRECPHCLQEFKWYHGSAADQPEGEADPPAYYCPRCGVSAAPDRWWTQDQLAFMQEYVAGPALREVTDEIEKAFRGVRGVTFKRGHLDEPEPPSALHEPNDMIILAPPCHPWEPVKVPEDATAPAYCLLCGKAFAA